MLSTSKSRVSVNGWFHGPPIMRQQPYIEPPLAFVSPEDLPVCSNTIVILNTLEGCFDLVGQCCYMLFDKHYYSAIN